MNAGRFDELLDRYQLGDAAPGEIEELERSLRAEAPLRQLFVERCLLDVQLRKVCTAAPALATAPPLRPFRRVAVWLAAASVLLAVGIGFALFGGFGRSVAPAAEVTAGQVSIGGVAATRIPEGVPFEVTGKKSAVIRLSDGSLAEVAPSSKAEIIGRRGQVRQVLALTQGSGKFQVTHGGGQFRVETPVGAVVALGTAFSVKLRPPAKTGGPQTGAKTTMAVTVTEGTVQVDTKDKSYKLAKGDRRLFGDDGEQNNVDDGEQNNHDGDQN